jgi:hypothetical protein
MMKVNWDNLFKDMSEKYHGRLICVDDKLHVYFYTHQYVENNMIMVDQGQFELQEGPMDLVRVLCSDGDFYITCNSTAILKLACGRF